MALPNLPLLKPQSDFLLDTQTKFIGLAGSYRAGKTFTLCAKAIYLAGLNPGYDGILTEPTQGMVNGVLCPTMEEVLHKLNFREGRDYHFYSSAIDPRYSIRIAGEWTNIRLMASENYNRIRGFSAAWFGCDEFDISGYEICNQAWQKLVARLTYGNVMQGFVTSTKEGYQWLYKYFIEDVQKLKAEGKYKDNRKLIDIFVRDNPFIDPEYVETMRTELSPKQFEAYINNEFCNFHTGTVYYCFDRKFNVSAETVEKRNTAPLFVGTDFNVGKMATIVGIQNAATDETHIVDEIYGFENTEALIGELKRRYPKREIHCYPDASGNAKRTNASQTDISLLRSAFGHDNVHFRPKNLPIRDRIGVVNARLCAADQKTRRLFINTMKCPILTACLEKQGFDQKGEPDKANDVDHFPDALGYLVSYLYPPRSRNPSVQLVKG